MYKYTDVWCKDNQYVFENPNDASYEYMQILAYKKVDGTYMLAGEYQDIRKQEYNSMDIYNQIDVIYQGLKTVMDSGLVQFSQDTIDWINKRTEIKNNVPKPPIDIPYIKSV